MVSNSNKIGLALILSLTTALSLNLSATEQQIEVPAKEGYYYFPPHQLREWSQLTPAEQKKATELGYNREAFAKWVSSQTSTPTWGESMGYTQPKK